MYKLYTSWSDNGVVETRWLTMPEDSAQIWRWQRDEGSATIFISKKEAIESSEFAWFLPHRYVIVPVVNTNRSE